MRQSQPSRSGITTAPPPAGGVRHNSMVIRKFITRPQLCVPEARLECSHGWSGAAAQRPDAQPVESGYSSSSSRPVRGEGVARTGAPAQRFLRPLRGGSVEYTPQPRVALGPPCGSPSFTRGYNPPPLRGENGNSPVAGDRWRTRSPVAAPTSAGQAPRLTLRCAGDSASLRASVPQFLRASVHPSLRPFVPVFLCLLALLASGCRSVTPEAYYHLHATLVDAAAGAPMAETRVAASFARVGNPDIETEEVVSTGWTDSRGTFTLVLRQVGAEVKVWMWGAYGPGLPDVLDRVFLYVWRGTAWQRIALELAPSVQANAISGRRWIDADTLKIPPPTSAAKQAPARTVPASGRPEVPPPPKKPPAVGAPSTGPPTGPPPPKTATAPPAPTPAPGTPTTPGTPAVPPPPKL